MQKTNGAESFQKIIGLKKVNVASREGFEDPAHQAETA